MKKAKSSLSPKLRNNWWIDAALSIGAVIAILSSFYFLIYPESGYQGGRNPYYNQTLIFNRYSWDMLHTWGGIVMIMAAIAHIIIHWGWITSTISRTWQRLTGKRGGFGSRLTYNIVLDATIAISFLICALSSFYFLAFPASKPIGQVFIFGKTTWDLIHTWSGVVMVMAAILHFSLHWKWIVNITGKIFKTHKREEQIESIPTHGLTTS